MHVLGVTPKQHATTFLCVVAFAPAQAEKAAARVRSTARRLRDRVRGIFSRSSTGRGGKAENEDNTEEHKSAEGPGCCTGTTVGRCVDT